jgi:hypothetical protein
MSVIAATVGESAAAFVARLAARAARLAAARVRAARPGRSEHRWREARLLWPLFAADEPGS